MKSIQLKDYEVKILKEGENGLLKDVFRVLEFKTQTHYSKGCLYCDFFDTKEEARKYFEKNREDDNCEALILKPREILKRLNEFDEVVY